MTYTELLDFMQLAMTAIPALPVMRPPPANRPGLILLSAVRCAPGYYQGLAAACYGSVLRFAMHSRHSGQGGMAVGGGRNTIKRQIIAARQSPLINGR